MGTSNCTKETSGLSDHVLDQIHHNMMIKVAMAIKQTLRLHGYSTPLRANIGDVVRRFYDINIEVSKVPYDKTLYTYVRNVIARTFQSKISPLYGVVTYTGRANSIVIYCDDMTKFDELKLRAVKSHKLFNKKSYTRKPGDKMSSDEHSIVMQSSFDFAKSADDEFLKNALSTLIDYVPTSTCSTETNLALTKLKLLALELSSDK